MESLLQPKYIFAAFNVLVILLSFYQGYRAGKARATQDIMRALRVPDDCEIASVSYRKKGR